jgi:DNA-binding transcriptional LysR family regulator
MMGGVQDIDVKTLRLFVAVCEWRTMARAADQERIEPSAISKRIAQLESDLGVELLMRGRRGVQPTAAGVALLDRARNVLFTLERMAGDAAAFGSGIQGHVRLLATVSVIAGALADDVAAFTRVPANRNIRIDIDERASRDLVREVREGSASLGICWDGVDLRGLRQCSYRRDRLALAVHPRHPLAARTSLAFEETLDAGHVGLPPSSSVHAMLTRAAARAGRSIDYRAIVSSFDAVLRVVAAELGVGVVPLGVGRRSALDLRLLPLEDGWAERRFAICFRDLDSLPPASQRLVEHLQLRAADAEAQA